MNSLFVEGKADEKFVFDLIYFLNPEFSNIVKIIPTNGFQNISKFKNQIEKTKDFGGQNLIIFDADDNIETKQDLIAKIAHELNLEIATFFFPNNSDNGCLEDLLSQIINPKHQGIIDCFEQYQLCLSKQETKYTLPNKKAKIYAYLEALLSSQKSAQIKEENRNYLDREIWDLDSENLTPLKNFLNQIF